MGTNNQELLNDPLYIGQKMPRMSGEQYDDLVGLMNKANALDPQRLKAPVSTLEP